MRHPRTDFPQDGWLSFVERTVNVPTKREGSELLQDSFRMPERMPLRRNGPFYADAVQQWWTTFVPAITPYIVRQDWHIDTVRTGPGKKYLRDTNVDNAWIQSVAGTAAVFNPALFPFSEINSVGRYFSDRTLYQDGEVKPRSGNSTEVPPPAFDPSTIIWSIDSGLPASKKKPSHWLDAMQGRGAAAILDPRKTDAAYAQLWNSFRTDKAGRPWPLLKSDDMGWVYRAAVNPPINANLFPRTLDERAKTRKLLQEQFYSWTGDNAWIFNAVPPYDPRIFPRSLDVRTTDQKRLKEQYYPFYYDLSWIHDVIPLTDPVVVNTVIPRPIAPIMAARRRNKRRR